MPFKKSVLGEEPVGCADSLYGLARLYWSKGAYDEAEPWAVYEGP